MTIGTTAYLTVVAVPVQPGILLPPNAANVPHVGQTYTLLPAKNLLGRSTDPDITIVLPWLNISRRHALIEFFSPGSWEIEDLHSRNGTHVNGQKLQPNALCPLNDGDRIGLPDRLAIEFLFHLQLRPPQDEKISYEEFLEQDEFR